MLQTIGNWLVSSAFGKILIAYMLTFPIAYLREKEGHSVGVRTFPIVAIASCGYILISRVGSPDAITRVLQGLIAGIGFIGGGAILKDGGTVHGTSAAASIWSTGVIGAAVAMDRFDVAIILAVLNVLTLHFMKPLKEKLDHPNGGKDEKHA